MGWNADRPPALDNAEAIERLRAQIPALQHRIYMNTGTSGPSPRRVSEAQIAWVERLEREGGGSPTIWEPWSRLIEDTRAGWARILGASPEEIALTHNTSEGIALVVAGLDWKPGDEVVVSELEHISGLIPWAYLQQARGVKVRYVRAAGGQLDCSAVEAAMSDRTRLLFFSHVSYSTGAILPARELVSLAARRGVLTLIDGAQAVGHVPLNVAEFGCDFYAVPGQKWLLGPEGTGALYIRRDRLPQLSPSLLGWASTPAMTVDFDALPEELLHPDARRFEVATPALVTVAGIEAAIRFMEELGLQAVWERIRRLARLCRDTLAAIPGIFVFGAQTPEAFSGLVSFTVDGHEPEAVVQYLFNEHGIVCRSIPHPRAVRVSLHVFNTEEEVEKLARALRALIG